MTLGTHFKMFRNHWCGMGHRCTVWLFMIVIAVVVISPGWLSYWSSPWKPDFASIEKGMELGQVQQIMGHPSQVERVESPPYADTPVSRWIYHSPFRMISYTISFDRHQRVCANSQMQ